MKPKKKILYRQEAIEARNHLYGEIILISQPKVKGMLLGFIVMIFCALCFLSLSSYTQFQAVQGTILPSEGLVMYRAEHGGTVEKIAVREGGKLSVGDELLQITAISQSSMDQQIQLLQQQTQLIDHQIQEEQGLYQEQVAALHSEKQSKAIQLAVLQQQIQMHANLIDQMVEELNRLQQLAKKKQVAQTVIVQKASQLADQRSDHASFLMQRENLTARMTQLAHEVTLRDADYTLTKTKLDKSRLQIQAKMLAQQQAMRQIYYATSPGMVTLLQVHAGEQVQPGDLLAMMAVQGQSEQYYAELKVPSTAIGQVQVGQKVALRLDSYPYQKFGPLAGVVASVSGSPISPQSSKTASDKAYFKIRVRLPKQYVSYQQQQYALLPGMTLTGNLMLDERSLLAWIFDPLLNHFS